MQHLPSVSTSRSRSGHRAGRAAGFSGLKTVLPPGQGLEGEKLLGVGRRGKYLVLNSPPVAAPSFTYRRRVVWTSRCPRSTPSREVPLFALSCETTRHARSRAWPRAQGWLVGAGRGDEGPLEASARNPGDGVRGSVAHEPGNAAPSHTPPGSEVCGRHRARLRGRRAEPRRLVAFLVPQFAEPSGRRRLVAEVRSVLSDAIASERRRTGGLSEPKLAPHLQCTIGLANLPGLR